MHWYKTERRGSKMIMVLGSIPTLRLLKKEKYKTWLRQIRAREKGKRRERKEERKVSFGPFMK